MVNRKIDSDNNDTQGHAMKFRPDDKPGMEDTEAHLARGRGGIEDADTEGHAARPGRIEDADTEGHAYKPGRVDDADTEGHMPRIRIVDDADTDVEDAANNTEGHAIRGKGGLEEADTDGHATRFRGVEDADTEGHVLRGKG